MPRSRTGLPDASHLHENTPELTGQDAQPFEAEVGSALFPDETETTLEEEVYPDDILPDDVRTFVTEETP